MGRVVLGDQTDQATADGPGGKADGNRLAGAEHSHQDRGHGHQREGREDEAVPQHHRRLEASQRPSGEYTEDADCQSHSGKDERERCPEIAGDLVGRTRGSHLAQDGQIVGGQCDGDRGDNGRHHGFVDVGPHAGDIADIVSNIVRNPSGVARIVLRNPLHDLAGDVGSDIGGLGVDAPAYTSEERDGAGAHRKSVEHGAVAGKQECDAGQADQAEPCHRESHDRAAVEGSEQCVRLALRARRFRGADIGKRGRLHPAEAGQKGEQRTNHESGTRRNSQPPRNQPENHHHVRGQDSVFPHEERHGPFTDVARDSVHGTVARRQRSNTHEEIGREQQARNAAD